MELLISITIGLFIAILTYGSLCLANKLPYLSNDVSKQSALLIFLTLEGLLLGVAVFVGIMI